MRIRRLIAFMVACLGAIGATSAQPAEPLTQLATIGDTAWRHRGWITSIEPTADGKHVVTTARDGSARIWDAVTGNQRHLLPGDGKEDVWYAHELAGGKRLLTCGGDGQVTLWDIDTDTAKVIRTYNHGGTVFRIAIAPDQKTLVACDSQKAAVQWDIETGKELRKFAAHSEDVYTVAISPDGKTLATGSEDKSIILWNLETGEQIRQFTKCGGDVFTLAFMPDGRSIVSVSGDQILRRWNLDGTEQWQRSLPGIARTIDPNADGSRLVCQTSNRELQIIDATNGQSLKTLPIAIEGYPARFSADGKRVYAGLGNTLGCWEIESGRRVHPVTTDGQHPVYGGVQAMAVTPDGSHVLIGDEGNRLHIWNVEQGRRVGVVDLKQQAQSVDVSADGKLAVAGGRERASVVNIADGQVVAELSTAGSVEQWFWADRDQAVIAGDNTNAHRFDRQTNWSGHGLRWPERDGSHNWLAAAPTGEVAAVEWSNGGSRTARIVNLSKGTEVGEMRVASDIRMFCFAGGAVSLLVDEQFKLHQFGRPETEPITDAGAQQYRQWVEQLGDDQYTVREAATTGLIAAGADAKAALKHADLSDPEVAMRIKRIKAGKGFGSVSGMEVGNAIPLSRYVRDLTADPSGKWWAAATSSSNEYHLYVGRITGTGLKQIADLTVPQGPERVAFASQSNRLFVGNADGTVTVYQITE